MVLRLEPPLLNVCFTQIQLRNVCILCLFMKKVHKIQCIYLTLNVYMLL